MGLNGYLTPFFQSNWGMGMVYVIAELSVQDGTCVVRFSMRYLVSIKQPLTATGPFAKKVRTMA